MGNDMDLRQLLRRLTTRWCDWRSTRAALALLERADGNEALQPSYAQDLRMAAQLHLDGRDQVRATLAARGPCSPVRPPQPVPGCRTCRAMS